MCIYHLTKKEKKKGKKSLHFHPPVFIRLMLCVGDLVRVYLIEYGV